MKRGRAIDPAAVAAVCRSLVELLDELERPGTQVTIGRRDLLELAELLEESPQ